MVNNNKYKQVHYGSVATWPTTSERTVHDKHVVTIRVTASQLLFHHGEVYLQASLQLGLSEDITINC